jgi:hypothetical protein|tara:strand:+ start:168 stop:404 length:237 start_codon:yes stop_codon:yes gene_type:complete
MLVVVEVVLLLLEEMQLLADLAHLLIITLVDLVVLVKHSLDSQDQLLLPQFLQLISQMFPLQRVVLDPPLKEQHLLRQ